MEDNNQNGKREKMVERIKKLLATATCAHSAKGEDGELTPEAQVAMSMAEKLMVDWKVSQSELFKKEGAQGITITEQVMECYGTYDDRRWQMDLCRPIYSTFDCSAVLHPYTTDEDGDRTWSISFLGTPSDVDIATWLFTYVRRWIWHEAGMAVIKAGKPTTNKEKKECLILVGVRCLVAEMDFKIDQYWDSIQERMKISFALTAAQVVGQRISDVYLRQKIQENSDCTALAICKGDLIKKEMESKYPDLKRSKATKEGKLHSGMSVAGAAEGNRIPLTKAIR